MIRKIAIFLLAVFAMTNISFAQQDKTKEINKIKKDHNYLAVTGTSMSSEEEASNNAHIMLIAEIDSWLKENSKEDVEGYTAKAKKNISLIQTKRGSLYRAFAYVKKSDILPYYKDEIIITESSESSSATTDTVVSSTDTFAANTIGEELSKQIPPKEEVREEESLTQNSEEQQGIQTSIETSQLKSEQPLTINSPVSRGVSVSAEEANILKLYTFTSVKKYMATLIKEDRIGKYGNKITDLPNEEVFYLIVFDYHGIVRKYIRVDHELATNLSTSISEDMNELLKNIPEGYFAVWFTFK